VQCNYTFCDPTKFDTESTDSQTLETEHSTRVLNRHNVCFIGAAEDLLQRGLRQNSTRHLVFSTINSQSTSTRAPGEKPLQSHLGPCPKTSQATRQPSPEIGKWLSQPPKTPIAAIIAGILILIIPTLLNYIVAIYLIVVGLIGLNDIYHFIK
jgi:hypothetical protein